MKNEKIIRSIYILNISLCFFMMVYAIIKGISGNDFFWHVKTGEWIFKNGEIPMVDVFSWYASKNNYTWYAHEWLADLLYYIIYRTIGMVGISILAILLLSCSHLLLMKCTEHKWSKYPMFAFFWFLYNLTCYINILHCRPYIFSFIFLNLELYLINKFIDNKNYKGIYFIPLIAVLWINLHGGSANLSYLLLILLLFVGIFKDFDFCKLKNNHFNKKEIKKISLITILTFFANSINPHGFYLVIHPYKYTSGQNFDMKVISEWQALDLKTGLGILLAVGLVVTAIILIITEKKISVYDFLLFGVFTYLMLKSIRFEFLFFIVASYIIFNYIPEKINKFKEEKYLNFISCFFSIIIFAFSLTFLFASEHVYIRKQLSNDIIDTIKASDNNRLLNYYNYGEELIFNDIPVFVDSRADVYSINSTVMQDTWAMTELNPNYLVEYVNYLDMDYYFDEKYNFDSVLVPSDLPINFYLEGRNDFKQIYNKNNIIYWERITE